MSYQDIAVMLDTDAERVRCIYKDAIKRLLKALEVMDTRRAYAGDVEARLRISEKASGKMPKSHRWFLLNKVFAMLPREIAEMDGADIKHVCSKIKYVADRVITGRITFLNPTPEEVKQAQQRIDKKTKADVERKKRNRAA
jgi:DNA-directed RNA polymerase specialized sigma24 family protein